MMTASHQHWCYLGQHFIQWCTCPLELPVNKACAICIRKADEAKDKQVQEAFEKIIDVDPNKLPQP